MNQLLITNFSYNYESLFIILEVESGGFAKICSACQKSESGKKCSGD